MRFGGATATGWAGSVELGSITFGALRTGTGDLIIQPVEWNDSLGSDIRGGLTTGQGVVGVDSPDPPLTPTPICCRVTPSANPTLVIESPRASDLAGRDNSIAHVVTGLSGGRQRWQDSTTNQPFLGRL